MTQSALAHAAPRNLQGRSAKTRMWGPAPPRRTRARRRRQARRCWAAGLRAEAAEAAARGR
eukprot:144739-Chlamydomonas_euryale.AAC.1